MADYYTYFSIVMKLPDLAAQQYALALAEKAKELAFDGEPPAEIPTELHENISMWYFDTEAGGNEKEPAIWLHSGDGGIDAVCDFIQHLLKRFNPLGYVAFEWSNDCTKPRTDAYGGGAAFITAEEIRSTGTWNWISEQTSQCPSTLTKAYV